MIGFHGALHRRRPSAMKVIFSLFASLFTLFGSACQPPQAVKEWNAAESVNALRWPLKEHATYGHPEPLEKWIGQPAETLARKIREGATSVDRDNSYRTLEALALDGTEESLSLARKVLEHLVEDSETLDIEAILTAGGPRENGETLEKWQRDRDAGKPTPTRNSLIRHEIRYRPYEYAMLFLVSGEQKYSDKAKTILLRMAEVLPKWPVYYEPTGESRPQDAKDPAWFEKTMSGGVWGSWHPLDLSMSQPLLRTYDILRPALPESERERIEKGLFLHHKALMERFSAQLPYGKYPHYHNMLGYHLVALIRFGWVLDRPDFIHEAVEHWRKCLDYSYSPDGFFREVSPAYHHQLTTRLERFIPAMLKGYSDPPGYRHPVTGQRFDRLDLMAESARRFEEIRRGRDILAMPNGKYVSLNDDHASTANPALSIRSEARPGQPGLLGVSGVGKLSAGGMVAFLKFGGMRGHDHYDALNLVWYAGDREVMSDTGYLPLAGSGITQDWIRSTASHNTVAVDEKLHLQNRGGLAIPERHQYTSYNSYPPPSPRHYAQKHPAEASIPGAAEFFNQGRLLCWDATDPQVQAMEAEQENAYPRLTSLFRRTVVLVPLGNGEGYLVDIFRIRGGSTHDYFIRGGLDYPYTVSFTPALTPYSETLYSQINVTGATKVERDLKAEFRYQDGLQTTSRLAAISGSQARAQTLLSGVAPAIRRLGEAPFSLVRRTGGKPLETCFIWVHETHRGASQIISVEAFPNGMDVILRVNRPTGSDIILSGLSESSRFAYEGFSFQGRLAFASESNARVFSGSALMRGSKTVAAAAPSLSGKLLATTQVDKGDPGDTALVRLDPGTSSQIDPETIRLAHFDMGSVIRFSIPVIQAQKEGDSLRLTLAHSPGFHTEGRDTVMTRFPGWRVFSETTVQLDTVHP